MTDGGKIAAGLWLGRAASSSPFPTGTANNVCSGLCRPRALVVCVDALVGHLSVRRVCLLPLDRPVLERHRRPPAQSPQLSVNTKRHIERHAPSEKASRGRHGDITISNLGQSGPVLLLARSGLSRQVFSAALMEL